MVLKIGINFVFVLVAGQLSLKSDHPDPALFWLRGLLFIFSFF